MLILVLSCSQVEYANDLDTDKVGSGFERTQDPLSSRQKGSLLAYLELLRSGFANE